MLFFFKGIFMGVLVCTAPGPILTITVKEGLKRGYGFALRFGLGTAVADVVYCYLAFLGITPIVASYPHFLPVMWFIAGLMLLGFGIKDIYSPIKAHGHLKEPKKYQKLDFSHPFSRGVIIGFLNPGALLFWIGVSSAFSGFISYESIFFVVGVSLGSPIWFILLASIIAKLKRVMTEKIIYYFTVGGGSILCSIGIYFLYKSLITLF